MRTACLSSGWLWDCRSTRVQKEHYTALSFAEANCGISCGVHARVAGGCRRRGSTTARTN
ncbi:hypothetical protein C8T65DRAFT_634269 [Cerioporus squamosus]|nr:hypothetical protein C8T65DRAFT_634269 [Cerioporus squamosus]